MTIVCTKYSVHRESRFRKEMAFELGPKGMEARPGWRRGTAWTKADPFQAGNHQEPSPLEETGQAASKEQQINLES